jgi:GGDEF domain-containing protein
MATGFLCQQQRHRKGSPLPIGLHPCLSPHFSPAGGLSRRILPVAPETTAILNAELTPFDGLASQPWYPRRRTSCRMPRVANFLTLKELERVLKERALEPAESRPREREYDEKFHLLQAPRLLIPDLTYYREASGARGNSVAIAFIDIDDFKHLNTAHGHVTVDESVLPVFMRRLEAFTFARGYAYRMGGDEYAILLGNGMGAVDSLGALRASIPELTFRGVSEHLMVSNWIVHRVAYARPQ